MNQHVPSDYNAFAYIVGGQGVFGDDAQRAGDRQMVMFAPDGNEVRIENVSNSDRRRNVLLIAGLPLNEPIARYGPFVMNTQEEIYQALEDYQMGRMVRLAKRR